MSPKLILFDLGRVLADLGSPTRQMRLNIEDEEFWDLWLSLPDVRSFERGDIGPGQFLPILASELGIEENHGDFRKRFLDWCPSVYPSIESLIPSLVGKCRLALLSNTNHLHWHLVRNRTSVFEHFDRLFLSYDIGFCKPEKGAFDIVLDSFPVSASDILFLDDMEQNISAAAKLGIQSVQVNGAVEVRNALSDAGFDIANVHPRQESDYDGIAH